MRLQLKKKSRGNFHICTVYKSPGPHGLIPAMLRRNLAQHLYQVALFDAQNTTIFFLGNWKKVRVFFIPKARKSSHSQPISLSSFKNNEKNYLKFASSQLLPANIYQHLQSQTRSTPSTFNQTLSLAMLAKESNFGDSFNQNRILTYSIDKYNLWSSTMTSPDVYSLELMFYMKP